MTRLLASAIVWVALAIPASAGVILTSGTPQEIPLLAPGREYQVTAAGTWGTASSVGLEIWNDALGQFVPAPVATLTSGSSTAKIRATSGRLRVTANGAGGGTNLAVEALRLPDSGGSAGGGGGGGGSFGSITGAPADNPNLAAVLRGKVETAPGFNDNFSDGVRWVEGSAVTHAAAKLPAVGSYPWRLATTGGTPAMQVSGRGIMPTADGIAYFSNAVSTDGSELALGFVFDLVQHSGPAANSFNISFNTTDVVASDGSQALTDGVVHINFSRYGVKTAEQYNNSGGATAYTSLDRVYDAVNGFYKWDPNSSGVGIPMQYGRRYSVLIHLKDSILTITVPGMGSMRFTHPSLANKVGNPRTYFWWEPVRDNLYDNVPRLFAAWGGSPSRLDVLPGYGGTSPIIPDLSPMATLPAEFRLFNTGATAPLMQSAIIPSNVRLKIGGTGTQVRGSYNNAQGGHALIDGGYLSNVGSVDVGGSFLGRATMAMSEAMTATVSTGTTGSEIAIKNFNRLSTLEAGDSESFRFLINLSGAGSKRVRIKNTNNFVWFDSDAVGTPLNGLAVPMEIVATRKCLSATTDVIYTHAIVNGGVIGPQRMAFDFGAVYVQPQLLVTQSVASSIVLEEVEHVVKRINNL